MQLRRVDWPLRTPFRISTACIDAIETLQVCLSDGRHEGTGEAAGVFYRGETVESMREQLLAVGTWLGDDLSHEEVERLLPPGGARNALDCALWDLRAARSAMAVHQLLGVVRLRDLDTFFTLGLAPAAETAAAARAAVTAGRTLLKVKLDGHDDEARIAAVRSAAPQARLVVDANGSWTAAHLGELPAALAAQGVELIEQPLPRGADEALDGRRCALPLAADESFETEDDLERAVRRYQFVNIKLDKTGGLTSAWRLARQAADAGLGVMVGNMCGSSLAMAPAFVVAQRAQLADLDGPLLNMGDVPHGFVYEGSCMAAASARCWGHGGDRAPASNQRG